jgi:hypothetical protein
MFDSHETRRVPRRFTSSGAAANEVVMHVQVAGAAALAVNAAGEGSWKRRQTPVGMHITCVICSTTVSMYALRYGHVRPTAGVAALLLLRTSVLKGRLWRR